MNVKKCIECGKIKELTSFQKNPYAKDKYSKRCMICRPPKEEKPKIKTLLKERGWEKGMKPYLRRKEALDSLAFSSYSAYLKSSVWKLIRKQILLRDNYKCVVCNEPAQIVHHKDYNAHTLAGKHPENLVSLCKVCHNKIEFDLAKKRTLKKANRKLKSLSKKNGSR